MELIPALISFQAVPSTSQQPHSDKTALRLDHRPFVRLLCSGTLLYSTALANGTLVLSRPAFGGVNLICGHYCSDFGRSYGVPRIINREDHILTAVESVVSILEQESSSTIREWVRRVNLTPELANIPLSDADRTAHLPELFSDLISRLRLPRDVEPTDSIAATAHAKLRFEQGYSAAMLVDESRIFQVATFGTLHLHQNKLDQKDVLLDVMTIADEADRQLTESVRSFMAASNQTKRQTDSIVQP